MELLNSCFCGTHGYFNVCDKNVDLLYYAAGKHRVVRSWSFGFAALSREQLPHLGKAASPSHSHIPEARGWFVVVNDMSIHPLL